MPRVVNSIIDVGTIKEITMDTLQSGWLLCNGQAISRSTYSALFSIIGTAYGNGDGINTFNVPDFQDKFPKGKASSGENLGAAGGCNNLLDHAHSHSLTAAGQGGESHTHSVSISHTNSASNPSGSISGCASHAHTIEFPTCTTSTFRHYVVSALSNSFWSPGPSTLSSTGSSHSHDYSLSAAGQSFSGSVTSDGCAHTHDSSCVTGSIGAGYSATSTDSRPAYQVFNYVIKY